MKTQKTIPVLIVIAILSIGATVIGPALSVSTATEDSQRMDGAWVVEVTPTGEGAPPPFKNLASFTRDGVIVGTDHFGAASVGQWVRIGNSTFAVTFIGLFVENGQPMSFKVRGTVTLDASEQQFSGPFETDIFDSDGNPVFSFSGTVAARRIVVEPL